MIKNKKGLTLIELIITILILTILGTIAYFSLLGYSKNARDSVRVTDVNTIKTALELYATKTAKFPLPSNSTTITYSGSNAWYQWVAWDRTIENLNSLSKAAKDPKYDVHYSYSVTESRKEYQLAFLREWNISWLLSNQVNAAELATQMIWNYNSKFLRVNVNNQRLLISIPSITLVDTDLSEITTMGAKNFSYNKKSVLPDSYDNGLINIKEEDFNFPPGTIVYSWSSDPYTDEEVEEFILNLKETYYNSEINNESEYFPMFANTGSSLIAIGRYYLTGNDRYLKDVIIPEEYETEEYLNPIPDQFYFVDQNDVDANIEVISNEIHITGTSTGSIITISWWEYSINNGSFTSGSWIVHNGDSLRVKVNSASESNTTISAIVNIEGVSDSFDVTTFEITAIPDQFQFTDIIEAPLDTDVISEPISVAGTNLPSVITITGGTYSINNWVFSNNTGSVENGDNIRVKVRSSEIHETQVSATLNIEGITDSFDVTTIPRLPVDINIPNTNETINCIWCY